eukprot:198992-Rhodomonas_salina.1
MFNAWRQRLEARQRLFGVQLVLTKRSDWRRKRMCCQGWAAFALRKSQRRRREFVLRVEHVRRRERAVMMQWILVREAKRRRERAERRGERREREVLRRRVEAWREAAEKRGRRRRDGERGARGRERQRKQEGMWRWREARERMVATRARADGMRERGKERRSMRGWVLCWRACERERALRERESAARFKTVDDARMRIALGLWQKTTEQMLWRKTEEQRLLDARRRRRTGGMLRRWRLCVARDRERERAVSATRERAARRRVCSALCCLRRAVSLSASALQHSMEEQREAGRREAEVRLMSEQKGGEEHRDQLREARQSEVGFGVWGSGRLSARGGRVWCVGIEAGRCGGSTTCLRVCGVRYRPVCVDGATLFVGMPDFQWRE